MAVVEAATGNTVYESGWTPNIILNTGMNKKAHRAWQDMFLYACAGTGTTPNYTSGGTSTFSVAWNEVTTSGTEVVDLQNDAAIGDVLIIGTTAEVMLSNIVNGTFAQTNTFMLVGPYQFNIGHTSRDQLDYEVKRTGTFWQGSGYCGSVIEGQTVKLRRTWNFGVESTQLTYGEVGFSWTDIVAQGLFSRVVLPDPVTVDAGFYLRATYELQVIHYPWQSSYLTSPVFGFTDAGFHAIQAFAGTCTSLIATSGSSVGNPFVEGWPTLGNIQAFLSDYTGPLQESGTYSNLGDAPYTNAAVTLTGRPYVENSFVRTMEATFVPGTFVGTLRTQGMTGSEDPYDTELFYVYRYDNPHAVGINDQVWIVMAFSWARYFYDIPTA